MITYHIGYFSSFCRQEISGIQERRNEGTISMNLERKYRRAWGGNFYSDSVGGGSMHCMIARRVAHSGIIIDLYCTPLICEFFSKLESLTKIQMHPAMPQ